MSLIPKDNLKIRYTNINKGKDIKFAFLGDFHIASDYMPKIYNQIFECLKKEKPNYICILGDVIDSPKYVLDDNIMENVLNIFKEFGKYAKTFVILGNHDFIGKIKDENDDLYRENFCKRINSIKNVTVLRDEVYEDKDVFIYGYTNKYRYYKDENEKVIEDPDVLIKDLKPILKSSKNKTNIFLMHSPHSLNDDRVVKMLSDFDIIACGHLHNGCTFNFLDNGKSNRGIINPKMELFPKLARGVKEFDGTFLVMSGGIVKISKVNNFLLRPFNILFNPQMDIVNLKE